MRKPSPKPETQWFIWHDDAGICFSSRETRDDAIKAFCGGSGMLWKEYYKDGYRAIKCRIMPVKPAKKKGGKV